MVKLCGIIITIKVWIKFSDPRSTSDLKSLLPNISPSKVGVILLYSFLFIFGNSILIFYSEVIMKRS
jgi:hypothetical protein